MRCAFPCRSRPNSDGPRASPEHTFGHTGPTGLLFWRLRQVKERLAGFRPEGPPLTRALPGVRGRVLRFSLGDDRRPTAEDLPFAAAWLTTERFREPRGDQGGVQGDFASSLAALADAVEGGERAGRPCAASPRRR